MARPDPAGAVVGAAPTIGLLVKIFPKLSETFILEEILGLEKRGVALKLYALAPPTDTMTHAQVARVRAPLARVPAADDRDAGFLRRHLRLAATRPLAYLRGLAAALARGREGSSDFVRAGWLARQLEIDGVAHLHTHFISMPADIAALASRLAAKPFSISAHAKDIYLSRREDLERKLDAARFTVTCTEFNRRALAEIAPRAVVHRMYHGLDHGLFKPRVEPTADTPLLLSVGRLREKKGHDTLIRACALLRRRGIDFRCEIVGYGEERDALQAGIDRLGLSRNVKLVGALEREQVIAAYARAAVVVQPSRVAADGDRDGIPNVLLEAMAMGLPVVASRVSGIPELVVHGRNGLLVEPDQPQLLADAIERLLSQPALRKRLGEHAIASVAASFDNDRNLDLLCDLLGVRGQVVPFASPALACDQGQKARPDPARSKVAYVMNGFPRLSETFIAHEIHQLERLGLALRLYSVKREREPIVHPVVGALRSPLEYLPDATSLSGTSLVPWLARNLPAFARANARVALAHPLRWAATLGSALAMSWRHREPGGFRLRKVFVKEFLQAAHIADAVAQAGDVGHLHGHFCHGVATITWFASRLSGIPFSFTAHAKDIYQADLNPGDLLERKLGAARFVATCTCANAGVLRLRHPRPDDVHTIYHGLDTRWFAPAPRGAALPTSSATSATSASSAPAAPAAPLILSVGRFVEKKGFEHLVQACALLARRGVAFACVIVGERGDAYDRIRGLIDRLGLSDRVTMRSAVAQDELREIYRGAHVFALPCQVTADGDRDGFPNVLAEAMAMGVPIVTTPVSGIPEFIDDGVQGLLVPSGDAAALADALERVLVDDALHARLAQAGRQRICERFDSSRTTVELRDLFVAQLERGAHAASRHAMA